MVRTRRPLGIGPGLSLAVLLMAPGAVFGRVQETPTPSIEASARPPLIVAVSMDEAGIGDGDLQRSRELVLALLEALPRDSQMLVASFSGEKRIVLPPTADRTLLASALAGLSAGNAPVALPDGLFDIVEYLGSRDADARAILLVSAGRVREGDLQFEDPLNAAAAKHIPMFALAVGQGDGKLLRRITRITGGEYVRLEVADAATLAHSILPDEDGTKAKGQEDAAALPSPRNEPRTSAGLLGAAAIFFSLGGLLMIGIVFLLIRRMAAAPPAKKAAPPAKPARAEVISPAEAPKVVGPAEEDDPVLERTMVVNPSPILRALSGPGAGKNFPLSPSGHTTLGRSRRNDIVVPESAASAQHCRIDREGDSYVLHDLGSTNGAWVNGTRTERAVLQHGDRLKVGETVFTVSLFGDRV